MTFASVCTGIGGFDIALERAGLRNIWMCEIDRQCREVLRFHWPATTIYEDMLKLGNVARPDVLCGGTPCQSFSVAGLRKGLADPRGNLALVFLSLVERLRPKFVLWENVPGVHSSWSDAESCAEGESSRAMVNEIRRLGRIVGLDGLAEIRSGEVEEIAQTNDFDCFLGALEQLGYGVATTILDAQYANLAQRRERVFVVGCAGGAWQRAAAVLFDGASLCWDIAPSREKRKDVATNLSSRAEGGGGMEYDTECGWRLSPPLTASGRGTERTAESRGQDCVIPELSNTIKATIGYGPDQQYVPEVCGTLKGAAKGTGTSSGAETWRVRRLTPVEAERLQGFPDSWTLKAVSEKTGEVYDQADAPRYRQLGNAVAVPVVAWIAKRIALVESL